MKNVKKIIFLENFHIGKGHFKDQIFNYFLARNVICKGQPKMYDTEAFQENWIRVFEVLFPLRDSIVKVFSLVASFEYRIIKDI